MHKKYMNIALKEAKKALNNDDIPIGAIILDKNGNILSKAYNKKEKLKNATAHAELIAIEKACKKKNSWYLNDCILYTTVEPCLMCLGAIIQAHIPTIVYAVNNEKFGFSKIIKDEKINNHYLKIISGICYIEAEELMKNFFKNKR